MIEWTQNYSVHSANIGKLIHLSVEYTSGGYVGRVYGYLTITLKPIAQLDDAKAATIAVARKHLQAALEAL